MGLARLRGISHTNLGAFPNFPAGYLRATKIEPNLVFSLYEKSSWGLWAEAAQLTIKSKALTTCVGAGAANQICVVRRKISMFGQPSWLFCACVCAYLGQPSWCCAAFGWTVWYSFGILPASLVTQIAVGDVNSARRAIRGLVTVGALDGRAKACILKRCRSAPRPSWQQRLKSLSPPYERAKFGVCGWLALPTILHQIFGGSPAGYPRLWVRESAWASSSWGMYVVGLVTSGNAGRASLRTVPWGTQWGQLEWSPAAIHALLACSRRAIGIFCLGKFPLLGSIPVASAA